MGKDKELIRCFLAVEIPDAMSRAAGELTDRLRKGAQFTKAHPSWVKPQNMHFTVVFLGQRSPNQVERVKRLMSDIPQSIAPFAVEVGGLGVFPNPRNPKVLWVGVRKGGDAFGRLYDTAVKRLERIRYQPEKRPYHPHLTLARFRATRGVSEFMDVVEGHKGADLGAYTATGLTFFQSQLHPAGAIYTPLAHWPFQKDEDG
jgi:2'-5' RNA ligase